MNGIKEKGRIFEFLFQMAIDSKIKEREKYFENEKLIILVNVSISLVE